MLGPHSKLICMIMLLEAHYAAKTLTNEHNCGKIVVQWTKGTKLNFPLESERFAIVGIQMHCSCDDYALVLTLIKHIFVTRTMHLVTLHSTMTALEHSQTDTLNHTIYMQDGENIQVTRATSTLHENTFQMAGARAATHISFCTWTKAIVRA